MSSGPAGVPGGHRWLVDMSEPSDDRPVLYAIPHAGAGAAAVKKVCRALDDRFATVAVRLPGRESRMDEDPVTDLTVLADALATQIRRHAGRRHALLYGHCSGAIIAYEVARRLPAESVARLVVSGFQPSDRLPATNTWRLPRAAFLARVAEDGYLPAELLNQPELLDLVEPALRADYQAIESHRGPLTAVDVPILALLGTEDRSVPAADMAAWRNLTTHGFRLEFLPGGHNLLRDVPADVAAAIRTVG